MKRDMSILISLFIFLIPCFAWSSNDEPYLSDLIELARIQNLHGHRYWNVLLHYKKTVSGLKSVVDDPDFFLSSSGKTDPESELVETIKSLFKSADVPDHATRCKFPARYEWLKEVLQIDETRLPVVHCAELEDFLKAVNPKSATLVFPTAYMNSPASMFGHTLLRIEGEYKSKLLSYAVNYAANTGDEGGVTYLIKGLFGFFKGYFSILPYYEKIEEYNDLDMRDMWEYELNLTEYEVRRMVLHIWELKDIYSYYYFFDENCSYQLLFLLEAARPDINLTDQFGQWVIPSDTVRLVIKHGLVKNIIYRPSRLTRIRHMASYLTEEQKDMAVRIADGKLMAENIPLKLMDNTQRILLLDLAAEMVQYKFTRQLIDKEEYQKQFLNILNIRKEFGRLEPEIYEVPQPPRPEEGHSSSRAGIGFGFKGDKFFQTFVFRPAYHDLADFDEGFQKGSQIMFGNIEGRFYFGNRKFQLHEFAFIDIISLGVRDKFFRPISWKIYTGLKRESLHDETEHLLYIINPGFGLSAENKLLGTPYIFLESDIKAGKGFETGYSVGIGASAGFIKDITNNWKLLLAGRSMFYEIGDKNKLYSVSLYQNYKIHRDFAFRLAFIRTRTYSQCETESSLVFNVYF